MTRNKANDVLKLVLAALFAALVCVATMVVRIPMPATDGYANLGDAIILISAFLMPPYLAAGAAGIGSMLADLLAGYAEFAPGTFIIKAAVAFIAGNIFFRFGKEKGVFSSLPVMVIAGVVAECAMVLGYFAYEALILSYGMGAAGSLLGNVGQGIVGVVISCTVTPLLMRNTEVKNMMAKTWK